MIENRYAKIIDESTHKVQVGVGCPNEFYVEIGMALMDVEFCEHDSEYYVAGHLPQYTEKQQESEPLYLDDEQKLPQEYKIKIVE